MLVCFGVGWFVTNKDWVQIYVRFVAGQNKKKDFKKPILKIQVSTLQLDIEWSGCIDEEEPGIVQQLQILKYLIEIWPKSQENLWNKY